MGSTVSSVATTCEALTRSAIRWYKSSTRSANSPLRRLLAHPSATRVGPLFPAQLVDLRSDREILEAGQRAPSPPPLHPPPLGRGRSLRGNILRVDRLLLQFLAEVQQRLRQLATRLQPVRPRPVVPPLVALQFQSQTQILQVQVVSALPLLRRPRGVLVCTLLLAVALGQRHKQQRLQRRGVFRQGGK
jgi:hypothetical protein